jgi:hypothetical protein
VPAKGRHGQICSGALRQRRVRAEDEQALCGVEHEICAAIGMGGDLLGGAIGRSMANPSC